MNECNNNEQYNNTIKLFHEINGQMCLDIATYSVGNLISEYQCSLIVNELNKPENNLILKSQFASSICVDYYVCKM